MLSFSEIYFLATYFYGFSCSARNSCVYYIFFYFLFCFKKLEYNTATHYKYFIIICTVCLMMEIWKKVLSLHSLLNNFCKEILETFFAFQEIDGSKLIILFSYSNLFQFSRIKVHRPPILFFFKFKVCKQHMF